MIMRTVPTMWILWVELMEYERDGYEFKGGN